MGGIFGRRCRHSDNSGAIRALIASNEENHRRFLALMEKYEKSHQETMKILNDEIKKTEEQNKKILDELKEDIRKKDEEYELKKKKKKEKKELIQKKANEQLDKDINESKVLILKECENEFDDLKNIYCLKEIENIKFNDDIEELFLELFESENIKQIFLKNIINEIKKFKYNKKINCYNIQIIGRTGVGKSTLINALLQSEVSSTSFGRIGTYETQEFSSIKFPFIKFIDTRGTELSSNNNIKVVEENTLNYIEKKLSEKDPNKTIHCLFYCISANRFEDIESEVLLKLRQKYKNGNLPIIIVYTQNYFEEDYEEMKNYINKKLKKNQETEIGDKVEDINFVGVVAKKKEDKNPSGLDKLLKYLKLKAKKAFLIATVNMIKQYCVNFVEILLNQALSNILLHLDSFFLQHNTDDGLLLFNTLKNVFFEYVPIIENEQNLTENGKNILKTIAERLSLKIIDINKKNLKEFADEYSERIGLKMDNAQYKVINQNLGVKLNIKEFSAFQREGKNDLEIKLKSKSVKYSNINFAKKIYEKSAIKFKSLFKETIEDIIENEKEVNDLIINLNSNISEEITSNIDNLINVIKQYQEN